MTDRSKKIGGRRQPPGGRPPKGNVKFYCYVQPGIVETIDQERGALSRGEFLTMLIANFMVDKSNRPLSASGSDNATDSDRSGLADTAAPH